MKQGPRRGALFLARSVVVMVMAPVGPMPMAHIGIIVSPVPRPITAAGIGIARPVVLAIGIRIILRAFAGVSDHLLRRHGHYHRGCRDGSSSQHCEFHVVLPRLPPVAKLGPGN